MFGGDEREIKTLDGFRCPWDRLDAGPLRMVARLVASATPQEETGKGFDGPAIDGLDFLQTKPGAGRRLRSEWTPRCCWDYPGLPVPVQSPGENPGQLSGRSLSPARLD